jgi:hypothetical protein
MSPNYSITVCHKNQLSNMRSFHSTAADILQQKMKQVLGLEIYWFQNEMGYYTLER